ncbi:MAG: 3-phosphoglycerate dehydrogenase family protein [Bacteroidota bacterium]|nr:3-phosphoglycerate dehydrogenase family protein [Bacteroidota bacterium]
MFRIRTYNSIAAAGLAVLPDTQYLVDPKLDPCDAILLRSFKLGSADLTPGVQAVARCGAGVNNIPVSECTARGIVVFNTPGANANGVKELVICGLLLSARRIVEGITWARTLRGADVPAAIEKGKNTFKGPELLGKTLGVIGLGAIGVAVANMGRALGMRVLGHDPFISVSSAWGLSREVRRAESLQALLAQSDYITLHAPLNDKTRDLIGSAEFAIMKHGVRLLNFARGPLVTQSALLTALAQGRCACYVTDFVNEELASHPSVLPVPHLGASTPEAEDNCAIMAAHQVMDYLEHGIVTNSVNFPAVQLPRRPDGYRVQVVNRNEPSIISQLTTVLADIGLNIDNLVNKGRGPIAYNVIDVSGPVPSAVRARLRGIQGVTHVRCITPDSD